MLVNWGHSEEWLLDLDLLQFIALSQRQSRINATLQIDTAIGMHIASQGDSKAMKKWIEEKQTAADPQAADNLAAADTKKFLAKFGSGF